MLDQTTLEDLMEQEGIEKESKGMFIKSTMNALSSKTFLTPNRLVVKSVDLKRAALLGFIGLIIDTIKGNRYRVLQLNIELNDIREVKKGKFGRNKHVLEIVPKNGDSCRIVVDNYSEWQKTLDERMAL